MLITSLLPLFTDRTEANNIVASADSAYSHLEVLDNGPYYSLRAENRSRTAYSFYPKDGQWPFSFQLYSFFAVPPLLNQAKTALLLGAGAGSIPLLHEQVNPELKIEAVELDPKIIELGQRFFHLSDRANTQVTIADARSFIRKNDKQYDVIEVDLFRGGDEIPFYLATKEFFSQLRSRLNDQGLLAMNVYDPSTDQRLVKPIANTVASRFAYTYLVPAPGGSFFIMAGDPAPNLPALNKGISQQNPDLDGLISVFKENLRQIKFDPNLQVFTDNLAPIEQLSPRVSTDS
jgi:spermidine synthase